MNLPKVIEDLTQAQNNYESQAYANCFSETATVVDEGKTYIGRDAIRSWIEKANQTFKTVMKPLQYSAEKHTLQAEISGSFEGSPVVLTYQFGFKDEEIESLRIV